MSYDSLEKLQQFSKIKNVTITVLKPENPELSMYAKNTKIENFHVSKTALFKFFLPDLIKDLDKVLYLDSDILINGDLSELFNTDISDYYIAAADDMGDLKLADGRSYMAQNIGLYTTHYFNSGVMLLNLEKMRKDNARDALIQYKLHGNNVFMDQDALNVVLGKKRKIIDTKYNFCFSLFYQLGFDKINEKFYNNKYDSEEECIKNQVIIHLLEKFNKIMMITRKFPRTDSRMKK